MFIGNRNGKLLVQLKEMENKWDLLVRDVVGAQLSSYWANGRLEVPEIKWLQTNNYKFCTFCSVHFDPGLSPRPSFRFFKGLVPRLPTKIHGFGEYCAGSTQTAVQVNH